MWKFFLPTARWQAVILAPPLLEKEKLQPFKIL